MPAFAILAQDTLAMPNIRIRLKPIRGGHADNYSAGSGDSLPKGSAVHLQRDAGYQSAWAVSRRSKRVDAVG